MRTPISQLQLYFLAGWLFIVSLSISACNNNPTPDLSRKLPPSQLKADFDFLLKKISTTNPEPYNNTSGQQAGSLAKNIQGKLTDSMTVAQYYRLIRPFVSSFNDGHFSVYLPDIYYDHFKNSGGKLLPFNVAIDSNRIYIKDGFTNDHAITTGREITAINNINADKLISDLLGFISGDSKVYKMQAVEERFQLLLWRAYGFGGNFDITFKDGTHKLLAGIDSRKINVDSAEQDFSFKLVKAGQQNIGVLKIAAFNVEQKDNFNKYLATTFTEIKARNIKNIIIDIRGNGGGSTLLVRELYNYITTIRYKFAINETSFENGKIKTETDSSLNIPSIVKNKFSGRVFLFINSGTYSTAQMMANSFSYYKMGVVVGDSTAEKMHISGEVQQLKLPNTGLEIYCPSTAFTLPNHTGINSRVYPDHYIQISLKDKLVKKDPALDYCITLIAGN